MSITVILNGYLRPEYLQTQITAIRQQTVQPDEIWLWTNWHEEGEGFKDVDLNELDVCVHSSRNFKFHGRFTLGLLARTEYVAFFDDDTIPGPKWLENCLECHNEERGIIGGVGIVLNSGTYGDHRRVGWPTPSPDKQYADLVGHAWFMAKSSLYYLWFRDPISLDNGEDIQLSFFAQKFGFLPTYCPPHPPDDKDMWSSLAGDTLGVDNKSESISNGEKHLELRRSIVKTALSEGWKTINNVT